MALIAADSARTLFTFVALRRGPTIRTVQSVQRLGANHRACRLMVSDLTRCLTWSEMRFKADIARANNGLFKEVKLNRGGSIGVVRTLDPPFEGAGSSPD